MSSHAFLTRPTPHNLQYWAPQSLRNSTPTPIELPPPLNVLGFASCPVLVVYCGITIIPKRNVLKQQTFIISYSFWGSGIEEQLSCKILVQRLSCDCSQNVAQCGSCLKAWMGAGGLCSLLLCRGCSWCGSLLFPECTTGEKRERAPAPPTPTSTARPKTEAAESFRLYCQN